MLLNKHEEEILRCLSHRNVGTEAQDSVFSSTGFVLGQLAARGIVQPKWETSIQDGILTIAWPAYGKSVSFRMEDLTRKAYLVRRVMSE